MPVLIQSYECCPVVVDWCLMLCHTQYIHNLALNGQWPGTESGECFCPHPTSSVQPLGWDWEVVLWKALIGIGINGCSLQSLYDLSHNDRKPSRYDMKWHNWTRTATTSVVSTYEISYLIAVALGILCQTWSIPHIYNIWHEKVIFGLWCIFWPQGQLAYAQGYNGQRLVPRDDVVCISSTDQIYFYHPSVCRAENVLTTYPNIDRFNTLWRVTQRRVLCSDSFFSNRKEQRIPFRVVCRLLYYHRLCTVGHSFTFLQQNPTTHTTFNVVAFAIRNTRCTETSLLVYPNVISKYSNAKGQCMILSNVIISLLHGIPWRIEKVNSPIGNDNPKQKNTNFDSFLRIKWTMYIFRVVYCTL